MTDIDISKGGTQPMIAQEQTLTAADFWQMVGDLPDDKHYELVDGEIVAVAPPKRMNSYLAARLVTLFTNYADEHDLGAVFGADGGFVLTATNVRIPDASFVAKSRIAEMNAAEASDSVFAPDLAVEVVSPSETPRKLNEKTRLYLDAGCRMRWHVHPQEQAIEVWQKNAAGKLELEAFTREQTVSGGDVLPGFTLVVKTLFENMPA